jgi:hypothetical protein
MEITDFEPLVREEAKRLAIEHKKITVRAEVLQEYGYSYADNPGVLIEKQLIMVKLINNIENYYHAAFLIKDIQRGDCEMILKMLQANFLSNDQFTIGGLYPMMLFNETPGKILKLDEEAERDIYDIKFTYRVFIYTNELDESLRGWMSDYFKSQGYIMSLRDTKRWNEMEEHRTADYFLCHDSRDKPVARELYNAMQQEGLKVFFDEVNIELGDSIYQKIEEGIRNSKFGLILVSPNFIKNQAWAKKLEFESFVVKYLGGGQKIIIPVWHEVSAEQVRDASAMLAGINAANTDTGYAALAKRLKSLIDKQV